MAIDFDLPEIKDSAEVLKLRRAALRAYEGLKHSIVLQKAAQHTANAARSWTPPTDHIILVTDKAFDDFAGSGTSPEGLRAILGLDR